MYCAYCKKTFTNRAAFHYHYEDCKHKNAAKPKPAKKTKSKKEDAE